MGGTSFKVSCDELRTVGEELDRTSQELALLRDVRHDYHGILGSDRVDNQLSQFFEHWSDGLDRISKHTKEIAERVKGAARSYEETDDALVRNATPPGG